MRLDGHDFELFDLPVQFALDRAQLDERWKALQAHAHPDRHAAAGAAAQRLAMQWAVRINEAYQRLKDPIRRATLLCELHGASIDANRNTAMPAAFLADQMAWRESLDEATDTATVEALADEVRGRRRRLLDELAATLDERRDWAAAAQQVRALMFVNRFVEDLDRRLDSPES